MSYDQLSMLGLISFLKASNTSAFSRIVPVLLGGISIASLQSPAKALIINGSFEDPVFPSPSPGGIFFDGSTAINGWTVVGEQVTIVTNSAIFGSIDFAAQDGNQFLDLTGTFDTNPSSQGVTQTIPTIIDQQYNVQFYVGSGRDVNVNIFPSTVDLKIGSGPRESFFNPATPSANLDWQVFYKTFTATNSTTTLTFFNGNTTINFLSALDNVSVTALPPSAPAVPGPLPVLGVGSAFLWSRRLRKRIKG